MHDDNLLSEYQAAHDSFHHYDGFKWQSGAMLIAGSTVLWGLLFSGNQVPSGARVACASVFISLLLSVWLIYTHHYRQLYMSKLYRIHIIEHELHMELNTPLGFPGISKSTRKLYGPKGHNIDIFVCFFITAFGPIYQLIDTGFKPELLLGMLFTALASSLVHRNEKAMIADYESLSEQALPKA